MYCRSNLIIFKCFFVRYECECISDCVQPNTDDCNDGNHNCHSEATCIATDISHECICNDGWEGDGVDCTMIDECMNQKETCPG